MTDLSETTDRTSTIGTYLSAYGDPDPVSRRPKVEAAFTETATLTDPPFTATGHEELAATFGAVLEQFPDHTFERTSDIDAHHDVARYTWRMIGPDGSVVFSGTDVAVFADDGRIERVSGFFDAG